MISTLERFNGIVKLIVTFAHPKFGFLAKVNANTDVYLGILEPLVREN